MYYHVIIETTEKTNKNTNKQYTELDKTDIEEIKQDIVIPYMQDEEFQFNGYFLKKSMIKRLIIRQTDETSVLLTDHANSNVPSNVLFIYSRSMVVTQDKYSKDITKDIFKSAKEKINTNSINNIKELSKPTINKNDIFIVHGHDDLAKTEVARFIEQIDFNPIILHEQANGGTTIIEKIEKFSNVGFGIVLYTPCDLGAKTSEINAPKSRARQNVVFEHGYLNGKLGRHNVCALVKGDIEVPNDISGLVYIQMDTHGAWKLALSKELREANYNVDMNKVV